MQKPVVAVCDGARRMWWWWWWWVSLDGVITSDLPVWQISSQFTQNPDQSASKCKPISFPSRLIEACSQFTKKTNKKCIQKALRREKKNLWSNRRLCLRSVVFSLEPNSIKSDISILFPVTFQTSHRFPCCFCFTSHRLILSNTTPPLIEGTCHYYEMIEISLLSYKPKAPPPPPPWGNSSSSTKRDTWVKVRLTVYGNAVKMRLWWVLSFVPTIAAGQ